MDEFKKRYLQETNGLYGEVIPIEKISKNIDIVKELIKFLEENPNNKFKIELLMFPSWANKSKIYKIFENYYTHIRIKS